ncbi:MAG: dTDP-4-dehydrorhamnose reductase [Thiobacillaceae bacterium]
MRLLLTGVNGQVGWELQRSLATLGEVIPADRNAMDLSNADSIRRYIRDCRPDLIVNPAAYTAVDKAESEPELAMAVNVIAPGVMAEEAGRLGIPMVHFSTDYVFDGTKTDAYTETDATHPQNVYGKTKLAGEQAVSAAGIPHLIFRTSWVYGMRGRNFLLTMQRLARERDELKVVNDQFGAPTWSRAIAEVSTLSIARWIEDVNQMKNSGVYHLSCGGRTSWHGFTAAILAQMRVKGETVAKLDAIPAAAYPTPAMRPQNSILSNAKLAQAFGVHLPDWEAALSMCLDSAEDLPI